MFLFLKDFTETFYEPGNYFTKLMIWLKARYGTPLNSGRGGLTAPQWGGREGGAWRASPYLTGSRNFEIFKFQTLKIGKCELVF